MVANQLKWEDLDSWITPNDKFFTVAHYDQPVIDAKDWRLEIGGLVERPLTLTLADLKARPRQEVTFTLECSGNHGFPWFLGGIGTARWAGTPLAPLLAGGGRAGARHRGRLLGRRRRRGESCATSRCRSTSPAACPWRTPWTPTTCSATR